MTTNEIQNLIRFVSKSGVSEIELELKDIKIIIKNPSPQKEILFQGTPATEATQYITPVIQPPVIASAQETIKEEKKPDDKPNEANFIIVKAPMIGTFYRTSGPDKPPFVNVGDEVKKGQTLCIIEAMKLFNEIESEVSGKIVKILMNDSTPTEYDTPLFVIDPS